MKWSRLVIPLILILSCLGCPGPEAARSRGGGHGGDAGNYPAGGPKPASKIDGSKDIDDARRDAPRR